MFGCHAAPNGARNLLLFDTYKHVAALGLKHSHDAVSPSHHPCESPFAVSLHHLRDVRSESPGHFAVEAARDFGLQGGPDAVEFRVAVIQKVLAPDAEFERFRWPPGQ